MVLCDEIWKKDFGSNRERDESCRGILPLKSTLLSY